MAIKVSGTEVISDSRAITNVTTTTTNDLLVTNNATVEGSIQVDGDLIVSGTTTTISAENLAIADNMVYLNDGSSITNPDLGWAGNYNDGTYAHAGVFRDASDGVFKFYDGYTPEPDASAYIDTTHASYTDADIHVGSITLSGTVDGRDVAADGTKLDGVATGATADSGQSQTVWDTGTDTSEKLISAAKLKAAVETHSPPMTAADIKTEYESNANTNAYTDAEKSKLAGIEAGADVTDFTNVQAAGALMDSEIVDVNSVKQINQGLSTSSSPSFSFVYSQSFDTGYGSFHSNNPYGSFATFEHSGGTNGFMFLDDSQNPIMSIETAGVLISTDLDVSGTINGRDFDADGTKLDGIEAGATADQTITAGSGLTGGGTGNVTISHADTSSQASVNNSGRTFIQDITLDTYGHITGITSATDSDTYTGTVTSVATGGGLTGGTITTTGTISHADTSSQGSVNNSGATVIQDVTLDTYGHVTGLASKTLTAADVGALSTTGKAADSNLLDGIDSSAFLRSNTSDTLTSGNLTITGSTSYEGSLDIVNGRLKVGRHTSGSGIWYNGGGTDTAWFNGLAADTTGADLRWYYGGSSQDVMYLNSEGSLHAMGTIMANNGDGYIFGRFSGDGSGISNITGTATESGTTITLGTNTASTIENNRHTVIGYEAGSNIEAYSYVYDNTLFGYRAGKTLSSGSSSNTFIGSTPYEQANAAFASNLTAVGYQAGAAFNNSSGYSTAIGVNASSYSSMWAAGQYGYGNTSVGAKAGMAFAGQSGAEFNTSLGFNAGYDYYQNWTGSNNTSLGYDAKPSSYNASNQITLGNTSVTTLRCQVTSITGLSDARDKTDVTPISMGIDFVKDLNPVLFTWNSRDGSKVGIPDAGFIAQELQEVQTKHGTLPDLVLEDNPEKLEAAYGKLIPVLVKAIQELSAEVEALKGGN